MNRTIGGLPLIYWIGALGIGIGAFAWIKKKGAASGAASPGTAAKGATANSFTQAQEVQDFQVFSALTGAQQASDLNFLGEVAGLFSGGSSTSTNTPGGTSGIQGPGGGAPGSSLPTGTTTTATPPPTVAPAPPSTGTAPPSTAPAPPSFTYQEPGGPVTFAAPPPSGYGYSFQNGQWVLTQGSGVGYP